MSIQQAPDEDDDNDVDDDDVDYSAWELERIFGAVLDFVASDGAVSRVTYVQQTPQAQAQATVLFVLAGTVAWTTGRNFVGMHFDKPG